ncbi:MAG TPA: G5 domain-containing protein, partial [Anaerolineales bacterium]|nr:G5 domain-containing protein [Anaerolineales bacterium]
MSVLLLCALAACVAGPAAPAQVPVLITVDGQEQQIGLPAGSSVQQALELAGVQLGPLDRTEPPLDTTLNPGSRVRVVRVSETFEVEQVVVPFETQTLRNESLPVDQEVYLQSGENGLEEITYRRVSEDGVPVSNLPVRRETIKEPRPEIVMIGVQAPFAPLAVPGRLVYLRDGNAWMMEETTANRTAVVTSGDLDGRIFTLSPDRNWLLYTRKAAEEDEETINRLWVVNLNGEGESPVDLKVSNVIHFADFLPGDSLRVVYSTVEPRATAPGWQANNDLNVLTFSGNGWTTRPAPVLEANNGGVYGWWGTDFAWAPDGQQLVMARPDGLQLM